MKTKTKDIEIELRGSLSEKEYIRLENFLKQKGSFKLNKERILIDYSTFIPSEGLEGRTNDIRLRVTNKIPEIVVKIGKFGGAENRKEISVLGNQGDFDKLVQVFAVLGLKKGMLCVRKSRVYMYKKIEFTLVQVPGHSFYFEAEKLISPEEDKEKAQEEIKRVCRELELELFDDKDLFAYIKKLNEEANEIFDYENYRQVYCHNPPHQRR